MEIAQAPPVLLKSNIFFTQQLSNFSRAIRVQTDKILIYAFNSSTSSCRTVNFLTNGILLTFLTSQSKGEKAIDKDRVILNRIHLSLFTPSLRRLSPSFIPGIWPFWGLVIVKNKLTSVFLCIWPLIDDKFRHNITKVYWRTTRVRLVAHFNNVMTQFKTDVNY